MVDAGHLLFQFSIRATKGPGRFEKTMTGAIS